VQKQLNEANELNNLHLSQVSELEAALKRQQENANDTQHQLKQSDEEFDLLTEALADKDKALAEKNGRIYDLEEISRGLEKQLERVSAQLRRANKEASKSEKDNHKKRAETVDECLSARSFSENQLISLRDDALAVKDTQIALINKNNQSLRENIEQLETEIERMQADMVIKDRAYSKLRLEKEALEDEAVELKRACEVKEGKDVAMEVATKQNVQLLQLLQQTETLAKELETKNAQLEDELQESRQKHRMAVAKGADHEAAVTIEREQVVRLKKELMSVRSTWEVEERTLRTSLEELQKSSTETIEEQREELRDRREKHYEMLAKLQTAESKVREAEDRVFAAESEAEEVRAQYRELDVRFIDLQRFADADRARQEAIVRLLEQELAAAKAQIAGLETERKALTAQLHEMSGTVLKAVDKQQGAIEQALEAKTEADVRADQLESLKRRMVKEGTLQGKRRMKVELEQQALAAQLEQLREENLRLAAATNANFEEQTREAAELAQRCKELEQKLQEATEAQQARLDRILAYVQSGDCFIKERACGLQTLHLEDCSLGATRFVSEAACLSGLARLANLVAHMLATRPDSGPVSINLARNAFADVHVHKALARVFASSFQAAAVHIDLSGNNISADGIRALVLALGKNPKVKNVFVHRDGTIQGLRGSEVIYTVVVRDNKSLPASTLFSGENQIELHTTFLPGTLVEPAPSPRQTLFRRWS
jgi:chromosome segregation ATPase